MIKNSYPGKFIVIEGLDGSGKSVQAKLVIEFLEKKGKSAVGTKEPTIDSGAGRKIKQTLRGEISVEPLELQKLFVQDRKEHLDREITPALKEWKFVVCERYIFSTIAFGFSDRLNVDLLAKMNDNFLLPDLTIILDASPDSCLKRIEYRGKGNEFFEKKEKLEKAGKMYKKIPDMFENVFTIDGERSPEKVFEDIKKLINKIL